MLVFGRLVRTFPRDTGSGVWPDGRVSASRLLLPDPVRRLAAWCAVILLVAGVVYVGIRVAVEFRTAVVSVLLALLGTALLGSLKTAAQDLSEHFGAAGTSLDDLASNAKELLSKFGGTAASGVISGVG